MKHRSMLIALALFTILLAATAPAFAQATRTWVSGVGDDANPCSRTAPCKTFAGAISKTASGGEINVLDPGGFGAVTVTKPITISSEGFEAGVLVSGTNGIIVNVPNATDVVVLRGLDIEGLGTGLFGISVLTGGAVYVEKCTINKFVSGGINFATTVAGSALHVSDTLIRNNGNFTAVSGQGVLVQPTAAASATFERDRFELNVAGLKVGGPANATVSNCVAANNGNAGFAAFASGATMTVENSVVTHNNTTNGAAAIICAAGTTVRLGRNVFHDNNGSTTSNTGTCITFKNNDSDLNFPVLTVGTPQ